MEQKNLMQPSGNVLYISSKPISGVIPKKIITIHLYEETWDAKEPRLTEKVKTDTKTSKSGKKYGDIVFTSPLRFNPDGSMQPFQLKIPDELQRRVDSGEIQLDIYIDRRRPINFTTSFREKIVSNKRKERRKQSATGRVWKKGVV